MDPTPIQEMPPKRFGSDGIRPRTSPKARVFELPSTSDWIVVLDRL
jgi:hypothetical protein